MTFFRFYLVNNTKSNTLVSTKNLIIMSKYKVKHSPKRDIQSAEEVKEEKQFFKVAIIVTIIIIALIYVVFNYM